jgi:hypothetical protein
MATAAFAGIVHGVVVHTANFNDPSSKVDFNVASFIAFAPSKVASIGNATYTD